MISPQISQVLQSLEQSAIARVEGYSQEEIEKLERLYDVRIAGDLQDFLLTAGRSSGGVIGDRDLIFYRHWSLRSHLLFQSGFRETLQDLGYFDILDTKPLVVAVESETLYLFLQTREEGKHILYALNENTDELSTTKYEFVTYIEQLVKEGVENRNEIICRGDMLLI